MSDKQLIQKRIETFVTSYNKNDLSGLADCYSEEVIKFRNNSEAETKADLITRLVALWKDYVTHLTATADEITVDHNYGYVLGEISLTMDSKGTGEGATRIHFQRRYIEIWRKEGGRWVVFRSMDNAPRMAD